MKGKHFAKKKWGVAAVLFLGAPAFGFVVFDPTVAGNIVRQIKQTVEMLSVARHTYSTVEANLKHFSLKALWQTTKSQLRQDLALNRFGEMAGWNAALNTNSPAAAETAWSLATVRVSPGTLYAGQTPGTSPGLSSLAMVEAFDSSSPLCMNAIAQYRTTRTNNAAAENRLESQQLDGTDQTNSEVEQLNLLNASGAQQMHELESQGVLHACFAEQTLIANMAQRNAAAQAINDATFVEQQRAAHPTGFGNESATWQNYLP